jgi:hypothetical protein
MFPICSIHIVTIIEHIFGPKHAEQRAQIDEMAVRGRPLLQLDMAPFGQKFARGHAGASKASRCVGRNGSSALVAVPGAGAIGTASARGVCLGGAA